MINELEKKMYEFNTECLNSARNNQSVDEKNEKKFGNLHTEQTFEKESCLSNYV